MVIHTCVLESSRTNTAENMKFRSQGRGGRHLTGIWVPQGLTLTPNMTSPPLRIIFTKTEIRSSWLYLFCTIVFVVAVIFFLFLI